MSADKQRAYRKRVAMAQGRTLGAVGRPPSAQHGTRSKYNAGCRCDPCKAANNGRRKKSGES